MNSASWLHLTVFLLTISLIFGHPAITSSNIDLDDIDMEANNLDLEDVNIDPGPAKVLKNFTFIDDNLYFSQGRRDSSLVAVELTSFNFKLLAQ